MTEADYLDNVIELATTLGYLVHHDRPARTAHGWRTPISGHPGFPDLVMARRGRIVFGELKGDTGTTSTGQDEWLEALAGQPIELGESLTFDASVTVGLWTPGDLEDVAAALTTRQKVTHR